ncbi:MAG: hypothetical protein ACYCUC_07595 [Candidatus Dormibacteria bacterium]
MTAHPAPGAGRGQRVDKRPLTPEERAAKEERRRRGLRVSTFCLHSMGWVLLTFYATDYLPPLSIRATVGLSAARGSQYLVGYVTLSLVCLLLGAGFASFYHPRIAGSRYPWRWFLFPVLMALILIPAQGENELLTRGVEVTCLLVGLAAGQLGTASLTRSRRSSGQGRAAAR